MSKKLLFPLILLLTVRVALAGEIDYAVSKIPEALSKKANVVTRMEEYKFEIIDGGKARLYHKYALTILNENGDRFAVEYINYDKLIELNSFEGTLYDANGKKIKSLKKSDIKDISGTDEGSLMDDNRLKVHGFYHRAYPYTIEYETEQQFNTTFFLPSWYPLSSEGKAVMQSAITVVTPADFIIRYKEINYKDKVKTWEEKGKRMYRWEVKDLSPIQNEFASPPIEALVPVVYFAPTYFEMGKYNGDMSTWQGLGKFIYNLNQGRDQLPDNVKQTVHQLTDGVNNKEEKIKILYNYLQQNTRYISIQLGVGGWQTFDASYVATKKYGDCKALSNYMYSLLKEAGIKSHYTLIRNDSYSNYFIDDFPMSRFNHIIVCVPLQKDTMWLECTNQTIGAGYLGRGNEDRPVLLIDETGGKLVRTPKYSRIQNLQSRKADGKILENGELDVSIYTLLQAIQQDEQHYIINYLSREKQLEHLKEEIDLPHYDIVDFSYTQNKSGLPVVNEKLSIKALNYASLTGKRMFVNPNIISRHYSKLKTDEARKFPILMRTEYTDIDTAVISIPPGYQPEAIPAAIKLESKFGKYSCSVTVDADKITYYRSMEKLSGEFPASDYNELVKFYDQIYKADRNRVVLVKKE